MAKWPQCMLKKDCYKKQLNGESLSVSDRGLVS